MKQSSAQFIERLLNQIDEHFDLEELRELCLLLGADYDKLPGAGAAAKNREVILYFGRRSQLPDLLGRLKIERPAVSWPEIPADFHLPTNDDPQASKAAVLLQIPPRATHFTGRQEELSQLLTELQPGRIVTLVGPGGIGKTALAAEALHTLITNNQLSTRFPDGLILYTFYGQPNVLLAADHIARTYGITDIGPDPLAAAQRALSGRTPLLILDGAEEADNLDALLRIRGNSGVLVTSRSRKDVRDLEIEIERLPLDEAVVLLQAWGKQWANDETAARAICELIGSLTLAVRLAGAYLYESKIFAAEYLESLRVSPLIALHFSDRRRESIPLLLENSLAQVSADAQAALAVFGCLALVPVEIAPILAALDLDEQQTRKALGELVRFGLLRRPTQAYELAHPLLHTYVSKQLAVSSEQLGRLGEYFVRLGDSETGRGLAGYRVLDGVRPHIMALFERLQAAEQWETTNSLTWAMEDYLDIQGRWLDRITTLEAGLTATRTLGLQRDESAHRGMLGSTYQNLGQIEKAITQFLEALNVSQEIKHRKDEGVWLGNLGNAYRDLGQVERAIEFYQQALTISREISDLRGEGNALGNLGIAYADLGQVEQAIEFYQQSLAIRREIGDPRGEGNDLGNLGNAYANLGQVERALEFYQQSLAISREIGDRRGEGSGLGSLGNAYRNLGQVERAIEFYQQSLAISREISDRRGEGNRLGNLGSAYYNLGQVERAIAFHQQALAISREIGDRRGDGSHLGNLGIAYRNLGQVERAIEFYEQALAISREIGDRRNEGNWLGNLGLAYANLGQVERAIGFHEQALAISREIGYKQGEGNHLFNLGIAFEKLEQPDQVAAHYQQALTIYEEIKSPYAERARQALARLRPGAE